MFKNFTKIISIFLFIIFMACFQAKLPVFADDGSILGVETKAASTVSGLDRYDSILGIRKDDVERGVDKELLSIRGGLSNAESAKRDALNIALEDFWKNIRYVVSFLMAFGSLSSFIIFIVIFMKLASLPAHPMQRRKAMEDIVMSGLATMLMGGLSLILTVFYQFFQPFFSTGIMFTKDWKIALGVLLFEYKGLISIFLGIGTMTMILLFVKNFVGLAASAGNPQTRKQALTGILLTGIATVGLGGLTIVVAVFNGALM